MCFHLLLYRSRPNKGSTVVNSSSLAPVVQMRVIDYLTQKEAMDTQIGQELQMIIEIKPANGNTRHQIICTIKLPKYACKYVKKKAYNMLK